MSQPAELVSPKRVIEEMAFTSPSQAERQPSYIPVAPPPACDPPPTPPSPGLNSYQKDSSSSSWLKSGLLRGDASLRPNTGESNWADGAALNEVVWRIRIINLVVCTLAILFQVPALLGQVLFSPAKAVLGCYLVFFCGVLCCFELHTPVVDTMIRDNFGMLHHPLSRVVFLVVLASVCWSQGGLESILAVVIVGNALYIVFVFARYPEYRRIHNDEQADLVSIVRKRATRYAWANPDTVASVVGGERQGLVK